MAVVLGDGVCSYNRRVRSDPPASRDSVTADASDAAAPEEWNRRRFLSTAGVVAAATALSWDSPWSSPVAWADSDTTPDGASQFVSLGTQARLADTRGAPGGWNTYETIDGSAPGRSPRGMRVPVAGRAGVPATATAAALVVTAVNRVGGNFVSVFPSGLDTPYVSNVNLERAGQVMANLAIVRLGADGAVDVTSHDDADLIIDVAGCFVPVDGAVSGGRMVSLSSPRRIHDTRTSAVMQPGSTTRVSFGSSIPADAAAAVVNLTVTGTLGWGFLTCHPAGSATPTSSNLNVDAAGQTRAAMAIVDTALIGDSAAMDVFNYGGGHVIVDVVGYMTGESAPASTDGLFVPADPVRIVDTRSPTARLWRHQMLESELPFGDDGAAAVLNVTAVDAIGWGFLSVLPARTFRWSRGAVPASSSVNHTSSGETVANQAISRVTAGHGIAVYASEGAHVLVDYSGYFTGSPGTATTGAPDNPDPQTAGPPWTLRIPRLGVTSNVYDGDSVEVTDAGHTWHWTGTGDMGQSANVALFAHRTDAGGVFRRIDRLVAGDIVEIVTADRRLFTYEVVGRHLTSDERSDILAAVRRGGPSTVSLIACSRPDFSPTSLDWRIIVNARLVEWSEF